MSPSKLGKQAGQERVKTGLIKTKASGREAVGKAIELKPDLIVLDFTGLKAADEISKVLPGVKIVPHTIYWSAGLEAKKHGICRVVEKAKTDALVSTIHELSGANTA